MLACLSSWLSRPTSVATPVRCLGVLCAILSAAAVALTARVAPAADAAAIQSKAGAGLARAGASRGGESPLLRSIPDGIRTKMLAQRPLSAAAHRLRSVIEDGASAGFAGMALQEDAVVVWWKGRLPREVRTAIAAAGTGTVVHVHSADYSLAELSAASATIARWMKANPNGPFHRVATRADGRGLTVGSSAHAIRATTAQLPDVDVPVRVVHERRLQQVSRVADSPPYWGGARVIENAGHMLLCTTGFGVTDGSRNYLLTAGHCGNLGEAFVTGDRSRVIGTASREHVAHDLLLIPTNAGGRIYDGTVGGVTEINKSVAGWQHVTPGEWLCTSGSFTGAICGARATSEFTAQSCLSGECIDDLVVVNGVREIQSGDSGGPVFNLADNNRINAKGIISSVIPGTKTFAFQDFATANRDFGITPIIG